ncbi:MAG: transcriptional repressor NrdR [Phycisphaerales bacterium]|nr:transcriptional repressor NrdR [Phycisphaerales bacterium]
MLCPFCNRDNDKVIDSRSSENGGAIRRRRECLACSKRFTTYERSERVTRLMVAKRDGRRVPFESANMQRSVRLACGKRPVSEEAREQLLRNVEDAIYRDFEREIPSMEIGHRVAHALRGLDQIAYIRFASEYYQFSPLAELSRELDELQSRTRPLPNESGLFETDGAAGSSASP